MLPHQFRSNAPYQLRSSYGTRMMPLSLGNIILLKEKEGDERVSGRKARGSLNGGYRLQVSDFLSLKLQEETNKFPLLYTFKKRFLLKFS